MLRTKSLAACALIALVAGCGSDGTTGTQYGRWAFSGWVVDGASGAALSGATIQYVDEEGKRLSADVDADGSFSIGSLPYGPQTFRFSCRRIGSAGDTLEYVDRLVGAGPGGESSTMEGMIQSATRIVPMVPLSGALNGEIAIARAGGTASAAPAESVLVRLRYRDTTFVLAHPELLQAWTDSNGVFRFRKLPADTGLVVVVGPATVGGLRFQGASTAVPRLSAAMPVVLPRITLQEDTSVKLSDPVLASNVLGIDGKGLADLPSTVVPWFKLAFRPDTSSLDVRLGAGAVTLPISVRVSRDTLFLPHVSPLPSDSLFTTTITGKGSDGSFFRIVLDGSRRFRTRPAVYAMESNVWPTSKTYRATFAPGDTFWIRYSEPLDTQVAKCVWAAPASGKTVAVKGASANARAWIRSETLFVVPDQRLSVSDADQAGFKVAVLSATGSVSGSTEFAQTVDLRLPQVAWTSAKDENGQMRTDLGTRDSIRVVSSRPVSRVLGIASVNGCTVPAGLMPSDISIRGRDTLVFRPVLPMDPGTQFGVAFKVLLADGRTLDSALSVRWQTSWQVFVRTVENRTSAGYRQFLSTGDSLGVVFSEPVDTASFAVHMNDATGAKVQLSASWSADATRVVLRNATPLPLADYGVPDVATTDGDFAKAVSSASFDLVTRAGETARGLAPATEPVRLYTEAGLCAVGSSLAKRHAAGVELLSSETVVDSITRTGPISVTFNRALDTAWIRRNGESKYVTMEDASGTGVAISVKFMDEGKTLQAQPADSLVAGKSYYLKLKAVPGLGIRDAAAVHRHSGTYTGGAAGSYLMQSGAVAR